MKNVISENKERKSMDYSTFIAIVLVFSAWFILSRWILPWFGVPTCMGGGCSAPPRTTSSDK